MERSTKQLRLAYSEGRNYLFGRVLVKYGYGLYYERSEKGSVHTEALSVRSISSQILLESLPTSALTSTHPVIALLQHLKCL